MRKMKISIVLVSLTTIIFCFSAVLNANQDKLDSPAIPTVEVGQGVRVMSVDEQPIPPEAKAFAKRIAEAMKTKGYIEATDEEISYVAKGGNKDDVESHDKATKKTKWKFSSIRHTKIKNAKLEGAVAHGGQTDGSSDMLTRIFRLADGTVVELQEWNYALSGSGALINKELINQDVNGNPAVLITKRSPSGKTLTELGWYTDQKGYVLRTTVDVAENGNLEEFLAIAGSVSDQP